jgi:hypothetical protein
MDEGGAMLPRLQFRSNREDSQELYAPLRKRSPVGHLSRLFRSHERPILA